MFQASQDPRCESSPSQGTGLQHFGQRFSHRRGKRGHCHQHPQRQRRGECAERWAVLGGCVWITGSTDHNNMCGSSEPPAVGQPDQHGGPVTAGPDCSEEHPAAAGMWRRCEASSLLPHQHLPVGFNLHLLHYLSDRITSRPCVDNPSDPTVRC